MVIRNGGSKNSISPTYLVKKWTVPKGIQGTLRFWIPRLGFRIPGTGFQSLLVKLGFWIPIVSGIPESLSCISNSIAQDSGFNKQKFLGFQNPQSPTWCKTNQNTATGLILALAEVHTVFTHSVRCVKEAVTKVFSASLQRWCDFAPR